MRRAATRRVPLTLLLVALLIAPSYSHPGPARAAAILDYEIPGGRFFTQGNAYPLGSSPKGFGLVDNAQARFYTEFARLGGLVILGAPTSRRFEHNGAQAQVIRKGVFLWSATNGQVDFVPIMDMLADAGKDDWLLKNFGVPRRTDPAADAGKNYDQLIAVRQDWLKAYPAFFNFYFALEDPQSMLGLPTSRVEDSGAGLTMRFQRGAVRQAKTDSGPGEIALVDVAEIVRQSGILPKASFFPENPASGAPDWTGYSMTGKATYYGADFHGKPMANGQPFNMNDPTITACNAYPLGTRLKVTNKAGMSIEVKVTDTGGFRYPLVVDLSQAAMRLLSGPHESTIDVTVEVIAAP